MRMRRKKNIESRLARCQGLMVAQPGQMRGHWAQLFGNDHPLHIEIGCGKGRFIVETARRHPEINYLAIEREQNVLVLAMEKVLSDPLPNLRFLDLDAARLSETFAPGEVQRIYLNFSDPWPPNKQAKRRLTHHNFLTQYDQVLSDDGEIHFKTDNQKLFEFSLMELCQYGWLLRNLSLDLHQTDFDNILTEYEERFSAQGMKIYRVEAIKRPKEIDK